MRARGGERLHSCVIGRPLRLTAMKPWQAVKVTQGRGQSCCYNHMCTSLASLAVLCLRCDAGFAGAPTVTCVNGAWGAVQGSCVEIGTDGGEEP